MERHAHYVKQGFRNRSAILTANGPFNLTVPVRHGSRLDKTPYGEVPIDYKSHWQKTMWRTVESAYRNAPFFEFYEDEFRRIIFRNEEYLFDFNMSLLRHAFNLLGWKKQIRETSCFEITPPGFDLRDVIHAKTAFTDRRYLVPNPYFQVFSETFHPNLGLLDLIFNTGPEAGRIIDKSVVPEKASD